MSSRVAHFSSDDVDHLSNGFERMGRGLNSSYGSNHNVCASSSQNGWGDDDSDGGELKEEDVWGPAASYNLSHGQRRKSISACEGEAKNGSSAKGSKGRISWLSMELQAAGRVGRKSEHIGVGFSVSEAVQNGGKESNGGWAPGFYTRKVKIPPMGSGVEGSGYVNGWHEQAAEGLHGGVPQSAPVSISVWPVKCGYGESNAGETDADNSDGGDMGDHEENGEDNADENDERGGWLAPHEIVDREYARSQSGTFSVIEGAGRTLKGMDLRRVRNAVWSRTGFED